MEIIGVFLGLILLLILFNSILLLTVYFSFSFQKREEAEGALRRHSRNGCAARIANEQIAYPRYGNFTLLYNDR